MDLSLLGLHHPRHSAHDTRRMRRVAMAVIVPAGLVAIVGMIWLWPTGDGTVKLQARDDQFPGVVDAIDRSACASDGISDGVAGGTPPGATSGDRIENAPGPESQSVNGCGSARVRLVEGSNRGQTIVTPLPNGPGAPVLKAGDEVVTIKSAGPDGDTYAVVDHQRSDELWMLGIAFVLAVIAFARWRGVSAIAGLVVTFAILLVFVVPAILAGESPLPVAIVGSAAIMLTVLYLTHGIALTTSIAVLGTLVSLGITGGLAALSVAGMHLTGFADETSTYLGMVQGLNMEGLLLAGIVIGSLGVLDDVTVTQAATVTELARANPEYSFRDLYRAGTRVGRAHIASVINTIILAYAGSSLPLLIVIAANESSLSKVVTTPLIAQEIVRSAVATLGLIAAVPVTTMLAAATARTAV